MGCHQSQLLVLYPLLKGHHVSGHLPDLFHRCAAFYVKGIQYILSLCPDGRLVVYIIGYGPDLFPVKLLCIQMHPVVEVGLVDIEIHHSRIGSSYLGDIRIPEAAAYLSRPAPFLDLLCYPGISSLDDSGYHGMSLAEALEIRHHLSHGSAGIGLSQPLCGARVIVIESLELLYIYEDNGYVQILDCRKHIIGGSIGKKLHEHQVHVSGPELVPCCLGLFLRCDKPAVDNLNGIREGCLEIGILFVKFRYKRGKLRQICAQSYRKYPDLCFCIY